MSYSESRALSQQSCAVMVVFHPDETVLENIRAIVRECGLVVVVDNGSSQATRARITAETGVELISLGRNLGVATGLNRGMAWAAARGFEWVITFDQDSEPLPGLCAALLETKDRLRNVATVGPQIEEAASAGKALWLTVHPWSKLLFTRVACIGRDLTDVSMIVTSGSLTSVAAWRSLGGFDEGLFIDFVDTDFCLRVKAAGLRIAVSAGARLRHRLGDRERRVLFGKSFFPTHHSALRHYYIARNRMPMLRRHGFAHPHWMGFEFMASAMWGFRMLAFERDRWLKTKAMLWGTWDGLMGRNGPCPDRRLERLKQPFKVSECDTN